MEEPIFKLTITDELEIKRAMLATNLLSVIWDIKQEIREYYNSDKDIKPEDFSEFLNDLLYRNGINMDELYN